MKNKKNKIHVAVQTSSINWSGGKNLDAKIINDHPVVYWTIKNIIDHIPDSSITVVAPEFDKDGSFNTLPTEINHSISLYFGFDNSPLDRLLSAFNLLGDNDYILRIDGLNFGFNGKKAVEMYKYAHEHELDCLKFPDDFPIHFTLDVYRLGALRLVRKLLTKSDDVYKIHPKYYMFMHPNKFKVAHYTNLPSYPDIKLQELRQLYQSVFEIREGDVGRRIKTGDQLNFHYELASEYVAKKMDVLDIACGEGYGTEILSRRAKRVIGADLDDPAVRKAAKIHQNKNLEFRIENALSTSFDDESFDMITSMETIEHIKEDMKYLKEIRRILKKGGYFIFSTPQNRLGHVPMNNEHVREYSLEKLKKIVGQYFTIEKIIGIKQGRIIFSNDPLGTNTILVCRK